MRSTLLSSTVLAFISLAALPAFAQAQVASTTFTFNNPNSLTNFFVVPADVTSLFVTIKGAGGGSATVVGGSGAFVSGNLAVTSLETLTILVGGGGGGFLSGGIGGAGGGGAGGFGVRAGGGGRSAIIVNGTELTDAGGGGGSSFTTNLTSAFVSSGGGLAGVANEDGGNGQVTLTFNSALIAPIPEASTLLSFGLLMLGGIALTARKRLRSRRQG